jgi:AcrR family transcriptional regulator
MKESPVALLWTEGQEKANPAAMEKLKDRKTAARLVLVNSGIHEVKIDRLAKRLKVTRGSFYWHFEHHKDLLDALLHDWEMRNYFEIAQIQSRWARSEPDLTEVAAIWLGEDPAFPAFDMAIRVWARKNKAVAESVHRADDAWVNLLKELFARGGYDETESVVRARVAYFHQIGYYALAVDEDFEERLRLVPYYYLVLTGRQPGSKLTEMLAAARERYSEGRTRRRKKAS